MQMTKEQAEKWAIEMCEGGTYPARQAYIESHEVGRMAKPVWNDPLFTYGIEYGILIAVAKIFGDLPDENAT